jgi:cell division protein FtsQ
MAAVTLGVSALLALLYLAARETPVFAVRTIEVEGAPKDVRFAAGEAARPFLGESLAALDGSALIDELEALPTVRSATYDRAFPSTLRIFLEPEPPLAIVRMGSDGWVVSERGRIIRAAADESTSALPRFRVPAASGIMPGSFLADPDSKTILATLALLPKRFPARVTKVELGDTELTMLLRTEWGAPELRLGDVADMRVKLEVADLVLRSLRPDERASTAYIDVSVPERAVVGGTLNSQVEP